ncbi:MAG: Gfo/Idh/MocA family oxidoreductase [Oscillospiraceae bacterium]|nr:Gfo/Idh/MocA family oxidoreductase [Oscillospiraceae bacterium]
MKEKIKVGYIGLGRRGKGVLNACYSKMSDVEVSVICDLSEERLEIGKKILEENAGYTPKTTFDYHDILNDPEIDAVIIMTGWGGRPGLAVEAMRAGKYAAVEVGCSDTLEECFDLVQAYEETGVPVMMMENCCYGRREMMMLKMVKEGLFGEVVHCTGGYHHYLPDMELFVDAKQEMEGNPPPRPHYRLDYYINNNRENYPTHEFGPISKVLGINRGNRMVSLSAFASKARGLRQYATDYLGADHKYAQMDYKQGDIVTTMITCANGETVMLTLDTTVPRAYYSRNFSVRGTKGMSSEERRAVFLDGMKEGVENNEEEFFAKYDHPLHKEYVEAGPQGGHGGMDWLVCRAFVEAVKAGTDTPIDAYDTAAWLAIGVLSERSIELGGAPVDVPDFTGGKWKKRGPVVPSKYCLDEVIEDPSVPIFPELLADKEVAEFQ